MQVTSLTIRFVAATLCAITAPAALSLDSDGDGLVDAQDNCAEHANPDQRDTDGDFFGNRCDADLNNDGLTNVLDLGLLRGRFFSADPDADLNGDGTVNVVDLGVFRELFFAPPGPSGPAVANTPLQLTPVFAQAGVDNALSMRQAPNDPDRWYALERAGRLVSFADDDAVTTLKVVMTVPGVDTEFEGGALGFDFHPDFATNGHVYVSYTTDGPDFSTPLISRVSRFTMSPDPRDGLLIANPASEVIVLSVDQPYANHNGGNVLFGPDGFLYLGLGDGGSSNDPGDHGQRTETLLGAMLRLDVDVSAPDFAAGTRYYIPPTNPFAAESACGAGAGCPEIFAWGLRNPWRFSFDRLTGELWAGDVGQNQREEIDIVTAGANYGWRCREGDLAYIGGPNCPPESEMTDPVHDYPRSDGYSVTGGYVYRGSQIPGFAGMYVFADYGSGRFWGIYRGDYAGPLLSTNASPVSFAESLDGELYVLSSSFFGSAIYRLDYAP